MNLILSRDRFGRWNVDVFEDGMHIDSFHGLPTKYEALGAVAREYPDATEEEDDEEA